MTDARARKVNLAACIFLVLAMLGWMYYLNHLTPWVADDFGKSSGCAALAAFSTWFDNALHFYLQWGGRVWGEQVLLVLLALPDPIADALNALAYVIMTALACRVIAGKRSVSATRFLFVNFAVFACLPAFGQDILWRAGSANYLWASLLPLALLALFARQDVAPLRFLEMRVSWPFVFLLGIFAGWMNENVSVALLWIFAGYAMRARLRLDHLPGYAAAGFLGTLCGAFALWFAPGNFVRMAAEHHSTALLTIVGKIFTNGMRLLQFETGLLLVFACVLLLLYGKSSRKGLAGLYLSGAFFSAFALAAVSSLHSRIFLGPILLLILAAGILIDDVVEGQGKRTLRCLVAAFCLLGLFSLCDEAKQGVISYHKAWQVAVQIITEEKAHGHLDVTIDPLVPTSRFCAAYDLGTIGPKSDSGLNRSIAAYYGLHTLRSVRAMDVQER